MEKILKFDKIKKLESRKRLLFIFKLIILLLLLFIYFKYNYLIEQIGLRAKLLSAFIFYIIANLIISFSRIILVYFYVKKHKKENNFKDNFILGINQIASLLSIIALISSFFLLFDIDPRGFFTSLSIVAAALAILSKDYISNMLNGMILMFTDQISLNDYIKIGNHKGKVVDITLLNIQLITEDEELIYIPNNTVLASDIINYTKRKYYKITINFQLRINEKEKYFVLLPKLDEALKSFSDYIKPNSGELRIDKVTHEAVFCKYHFVMAKHNQHIENEIVKAANAALLKN